MDGEAAALAGSADQFNPPGVGLDQIMGDAQTQPHPFGEAFALASAEKWRKNLLLLILRNAWTTVGNAHPDSF